MKINQGMTGLIIIHEVIKKIAYAFGYFLQKAETRTEQLRAFLPNITRMNIADQFCVISPGSCENKYGRRPKKLKSLFESFHRAPGTGHFWKSV